MPHSEAMQAARDRVVEAAKRQVAEADCDHGESKAWFAATNETEDAARALLALEAQEQERTNAEG